MLHVSTGMGRNGSVPKQRKEMLLCENEMNSKWDTTQKRRWLPMQIGALDPFRQGTTICSPLHLACGEASGHDITRT